METILGLNKSWKEYMGLGTSDNVSDSGRSNNDSDSTPSSFISRDATSGIVFSIFICEFTSVLTERQRRLPRHIFSLPQAYPSSKDPYVRTSILRTLPPKMSYQVVALLAGSAERP